MTPGRLPSDGSSERGTGLIALLTLEEVGGSRFRAARNEANLGGEIFGGQYLGQSLAAAMATASGFVPQTLFGFFLRPARADRPLEFVVETTRQGRAFAHRRVAALQDGAEVFRAEVSLHVPASDEPEHQRAMPCVRGPDELRSLPELAGARVERVGRTALDRVSRKSHFEVRPVSPEPGLGRAAEAPAGRYWIRARLEGVPDDAITYAIIAYLSDVMANTASRIMHTDNAFDDSLGAVSLNHGVWFHRRPKGGEWFLYDTESCFAGGGIGSTRGLIYQRDGALLASTAQDALIRRSRGDQAVRTAPTANGARENAG